MKNYINNLFIWNSNSNSHIAKYTINKKGHYITIKYMDGQHEIKSLDETSEEDLQLLQRKQLTEQQQLAEKNLTKKKQLNLPLVGLWCSSAAVQFIVSNFIVGISHLLCSSIYLIGLYKPYKLKREIKLAAWIHDNRNKVDEIIKEDITKHQNTQNINYENCIYPRKIIEDGISLNNLELLSNKILKKLQKKAKKK